MRKKGDEGEGRDTELAELWNVEIAQVGAAQGHTRPSSTAATGARSRSTASRTPRTFRNPETLFAALDQRAIGLQDLIELRGPDGARRITTPGRVVFNHEVREALE